MLAPYDLREMAMLGDSGSNALGALLGLSSVDRFTGRGRWLAIGALAGPQPPRRAHLTRRHDRALAVSERRRPAGSSGREHRRSTSSSPAASSRRSAKGITAASLGRLLKARGLKVDVQKFDPYLNVDPGTMSPFQHGEVFVTEDGAETDLDIGHYERFLDQNLLAEREPHPGRASGTASCARSGRATTSARPCR